VTRVIESPAATSSRSPPNLLARARRAGPARWSEKPPGDRPSANERSPAHVRRKPGSRGNTGRPDGQRQARRGHPRGVRQGDHRPEKLLPSVTLPRDAGNASLLGQAAHDFFKGVRSRRRRLSSRARSGAARRRVPRARSDGDGKITPAEMAAGVGGGFSSRRERGERGHSYGQGPTGLILGARGGIRSHAGVEHGAVDEGPVASAIDVSLGPRRDAASMPRRGPSPRRLSRPSERSACSNARCESRALRWSAVRAPG